MYMYVFDVNMKIQARYKRQIENTRLEFNEDKSRFRDSGWNFIGKFLGLGSSILKSFKEWFPNFLDMTSRDTV